jgi:hypothetical protein
MPVSSLTFLGPKVSTRLNLDGYWRLETLNGGELTVSDITGYGDSGSRTKSHTLSVRGRITFFHKAWHNCKPFAERPSIADWIR